MKILKFKIDKHNTVPNMVEMPKDADVIHVDVIGEDIFLWAEVNPENEKETREYWIYDTGVEIPNDPDFFYFGTCKRKSLITDEWFVHHVYEKVKGRE